MKLELNYYKDSGKWYTTETTELPIDYTIDDIPGFLLERNKFTSMFVTIHIVEEDGFKQPYRFYKL
jgi:hypothetical protein